MLESQRSHCVLPPRSRALKSKGPCFTRTVTQHTPQHDAPPRVRPTPRWRRRPSRVAPTPPAHSRCRRRCSPGTTTRQFATPPPPTVRRASRRTPLSTSSAPAIPPPWPSGRPQERRMGLCVSRKKNAGGRMLCCSPSAIAAPALSVLEVVYRANNSPFNAFSSKPRPGRTPYHIPPSRTFPPNEKG